MALVTGRESVQQLLGMSDLVDLVIPRGSNQLVEFVQANTRIPVLGHAEGVCHVYVDAAADPDMALAIIEDSKTDYPAACNAAETVLVHRAIAATFLPKLADRFARARWRFADARRPGRSSPANRLRRSPNGDGTGSTRTSCWRFEWSTRSTMPSSIFTLMGQPTPEPS